MRPLGLANFINEQRLYFMMQIDSTDPDQQLLPGGKRAETHRGRLSLFIPYVLIARTKEDSSDGSVMGVEEGF